MSLKQERTYYTKHPPQQKIISSEVLVVLRLENPDEEKVLLFWPSKDELLKFKTQVIVLIVFNN